MTKPQPGPEKARMLSGYTALDLTDYRGYFCGKVLADLGADVIKMEPPGGDPGRKTPPTATTASGQPLSFHWLAYNANKKGATLNLERPEGRHLLRRLAAKADLLIESFDPGFLDGLGLGYRDLRQDNPRLIMTSITPFGQDGPYRDYCGSDLVCNALSGFLYLNGTPERPPVAVSVPQAFLNAGAEAAAASVIALYHRTAGGPGQHVDVSAQASLVPATRFAAAISLLSGQVQKRSGGFLPTMFNLSLRQNWHCKDGYVAFLILGGTYAHNVRDLFLWIDQEGMLDDADLKRTDWDSLDMAITRPEMVERMDTVMQRFFLSKTRQELMEGAARRHMQLAPVNTVADLVERVPLDERGYWQRVAVPGIGTLKYPGPIALSDQVTIDVRWPPPTVGQHNEEVYLHWLRLAPEEYRSLREARAI